MSVDQSLQNLHNFLVLGIPDISAESKRQQ